MRTALFFLACLCLITLALMGVPSGSHAQRSSSISGKSMARRFKPGEVLVRYRSESMAQSRTGPTVVAAPEGELVPAQIEKFEGSQIVNGLRLVRVPAEQTLKAVGALRQQSDVLYAEPNYILKADATPNDAFF